MKTSTLLITLASLLILLGVGALLFGSSSSQTTDISLRPDDKKTLAVGERIYVAECASCHGAGLEGQADWRSRGEDGLLPAPPHDSTGHTWHHPDASLFRITKFGVGKVIGDPAYKTTMPVYEGRLSDDEIIAVLSWIKSQWPQAVRQQHDQMNARSAGSGGQ